MISQKYKNAYKEVLEIIKYLPEKELSKIPKSKIEYFERNQNSDYVFNFDCTVALEKQNISREANAIILNLLNDYFFSDEKKSKLVQILRNNENEYQKKQNEIYSYENIFQNKNKVAENKEINSTGEMAIIKQEKKNFIEKIFDKIKKFFTKKSN